MSDFLKGVGQHVSFLRNYETHDKGRNFLRFLFDLIGKCSDEVNNVFGKH